MNPISYIFLISNRGYLNTEEEVAHLKTEYLIPLREQFSENTQKVYDEWLGNIKYTD